jgi:sigma-B regulation protein RsbU (phosphoserine phosphatase)
VRAETIDGFFRFSVANGGDPIPQAAMGKLFEPFFRGEVRASRQGLGLGLHIASQIAKAHSGVLSVTSTPQETKFTFEMPLQ